MPSSESEVRSVSLAWKLGGEKETSCAEGGAIVMRLVEENMVLLVDRNLNRTFDARKGHKREILVTWKKNRLQQFWSQPFSHWAGSIKRSDVVKSVTCPGVLQYGLPWVAFSPALVSMLCVSLAQPFHARLATLS